jgi:hypothetical protein
MTQDYYKLVRPDYTSFHDANFKWPVKGVVEVQDAELNGPCGKGLHLALSVKDGLQYARFPFRILRVRPLSPVLGKDGTKIRVAKAESLGELPLPAWAVRTERKIEKIREEVKTIPWYKGTDEKKAKRLIRSHLKLLVPFGFKLDFEIEIVTARAAARAAARDAARGAAWGAARDAAWAAARDAAGAAARDAAWDAAWDAAGAAARDAAWGAARDAARDAAWETVSDRMPQKNPFAPLCEVWKLGFWPIGFVGNKFKLFSEKAKP